MGIRKWNRTTIDWRHLNLPTDIPIDDLDDKSKEYYHSLTNMRSVQQMDQKGILKVKIQRGAISPTTSDIIILERLKSIAHDLQKPGGMGYMYLNLFVTKSDEYSGSYCFNFSLNDQSSFCDASLYLAKGIFDCFGIKSNFALADFHITQETLVWLDEGWITFGNWLRMRHGLRVVC